MKDIEAIAREIVAREGGYVNDPDDPGGATKYGVTIGTMRRLGLDLDGDGRVTAEDVRKLDRHTAEKIFLEHYFHRPRIAELPDCLHASVFDMYVNAGSNAVKILQRLLSQMGEEVSVDGAIGPQTIGAAGAGGPKGRRIIWPMPMGSRGATTTMRWPTAAPRAGNTPAGAMAARAAGSSGPRSSSRRASISASAQHRARVAAWG